MRDIVKIKVEQLTLTHKGHKIRKGFAADGTPLFRHAVESAEVEAIDKDGSIYQARFMGPSCLALGQAFSDLFFDVSNETPHE